MSGKRSGGTPTMEQHSATKEHEIVPRATTRTDPESIRRRATGQTEKENCHTMSLLGGI